MSLQRMRFLVSEVETIVREHVDQVPLLPVQAPKKGFFGMKEELAIIMETVVQQLKQRDEQMKLYGRTRLSITLGLKAQRGIELAEQKLAELKQQVERDRSKWISPLSDEEYEARKKMCEILHGLLQDLIPNKVRVPKKLANKE